MAIPVTLPLATETSPMALLFGPAAADVARAVRLRPDLGPRLLLAPARDLHARSAAVQRLREQGAPDREIADMLINRDPRELLALAVAVTGDDLDHRLYRLLDRARVPAWALDDYRALHDVLRAGLADALPAEGQLFPVDARRARNLLEADPIVRRARRAVVRGGVPPDALGDAIHILRRVGVLQAVAELPDGAGRRAVTRRFRRDVGALRSPHAPSFAPPPGWRVIANVRDLWSLGDRLGLCFGVLRGFAAVGHAVALASGRGAYLHHAGADVVGEVLFDFDGSASVGEVRGASNARAVPALAEELRRALRMAGLPVTQHGVEGTLHHVLMPGSDCGGGPEDGDEVALLANAEDPVAAR